MSPIDHRQIERTKLRVSPTTTVDAAILTPFSIASHDLRSHQNSAAQAALGVRRARTLVQARLADALLNRRVVLLCAPAGYGKTTALAHEIARLPPEHAVAWISADAGDDLQRLLECMLAALEPFDPPWRTAPGVAGDARGPRVE